MIQKYKVTNTDPKTRRVNGVSFESDESKQVDWNDGQVLNARGHQTTDEGGDTRPTFVIDLVEDADLVADPTPAAKPETEKAPEPEPKKTKKDEVA